MSQNSNRVRIKAGNLGALNNLADEYSSSSSSEDEEIINLSSDEEEKKESFQINPKNVINKILEDILFNVLITSLDKPLNISNNLKRPLNEYRYIPSSSSSSSEEESSSSSSSSESSEDEIQIISNRQPKTKRELTISELPPIEYLSISVPEYESVLIGLVSSVVSELVIVESNLNTPALDLDSLLFLDKGKRTLGVIFDVIGPVTRPLYVIRFNSGLDVSDAGISVGTEVYFAPRTDHTSYVFIEQLKKLKGSDASWKNDEEPPEKYLDYSDDEQERTAKKKGKNNKSSSNQSDGTNVKRRRPQQVNNNPFYRQNRVYRPRDFGPIRWTSHTPSFPDFSVPPPPRGLFQPPRFPPP